MATLNLGIVAHVDAGKTTLTERLLYRAGVIEAPGSVDAGTTQTDYLALERERGITIRAAVVAFDVGDLTVNLIDTPGHPEFIAEVERSLAVLDGAVLVVSSVEGVQAQTVVLIRALRRLGVPVVLFVNKIDRAGAEPDRVLDAIRSRLSADVVALGTVTAPGRRDAAFVPCARGEERLESALDRALAEVDEEFLAAAVDGAKVTPEWKWARFVRACCQGTAHPVVFGSAITGAGIDELTDAVTTFLPAGGDVGGSMADDELSALVFKVERGANNEKVAYLRVFTGRLAVRDRVRLADGRDATVTGLQLFQRGGATSARSAGAGRIAKVAGLSSVRVGDAIGPDRGDRAAKADLFAPPALETAIVPCDASDKPALWSALASLAEQDPLIALRQDDIRQALYLSLYGDVQKEVIAETLLAEHGILVEFRDTTPICIERVLGSGHGIERRGKSGNPFPATIGLRVAPAPPGTGTGISVELAVDVKDVPLYVYKTVEAFQSSIADYARTALLQGLRGWEVPDAQLTITECGYIPPGTTAAHYRKLVPLVALAALRRAGTIVCEPTYHVRVEAPNDSLTAVLNLIARMEGTPQPPSIHGSWCEVDATLPARVLTTLRREIQGLTRGEGVVEANFSHHLPASGSPPTRPRTDHNPLNRKEYLLHVLGGPR